MSWGHHSKPKPPPSTFSKLFPLLVVLGALAALAFVGYQIYLSANKIQARASESMGRKNVVFTKDGMRVGVRSVKNEKYVDQTQSWVVKAWRMAKPGGGGGGSDDVSDNGRHHGDNKKK